MMSILSNANAQDKDIDVKCTVYEQGDDANGNDVDVRILVMGLKPDNYYTANVLPDHNPPKTVTAESDFDGIFWIIAKIPNGERSTLFSAKVYEGNSTDGQLVASGDDDAPCYSIQSLPSKPSSPASTSQ
jgi:hypothetical protein